MRKKQRLIFYNHLVVPTNADVVKMFEENLKYKISFQY